MPPESDRGFVPFGRRGESDLPASYDSRFDVFDYSEPSFIARLMGRPAPATMTPEQVRLEARGRSKSIYDKQSNLEFIVFRHEATIQKRWIKKKKQQRIDTLESAWPRMAKSHRPDFAYIRQHANRSNRIAPDANHRRNFLCPYINQEDLLKPKALLLLINSRGRHPPSHFAAVDSDAMRFGRVSEKLSPIFLDSHVMLLNGVIAPEYYGELLSWDDRGNAFDWMCTQKQFLPGEGLLVLEAQEMVLEFLVNCCVKILQDIPTNVLFSTAYPIEPEPQLNTANETEGFESMITMAQEAPYRVPARLDFARIQTLLRARTSAADDHLWALREDPGYFNEQMHEFMEHRQEMLKDTNGKLHPSCMPKIHSVLWHRVLGTIILEAYMDLMMYSELHEQAVNLTKLHAKYQSVLSPEKKLPEEFLMALLKFRYYLNQASRGLLNQLKQFASASPPLRKFFVRSPPDDSNLLLINVHSKPGVHKAKPQFELIWLLSTLWENDHQVFFMGMPFLLDELERLLQSETQAQELISAQIAAYIGNLSIISHCLRQLALYQPWARGFDNLLEDRNSSISKEFSQRTASWKELFVVMHEKKKRLEPAVKIWETSGSFVYPSSKRRTKETTDAMILAERNLDRLWACVDRALHVELHGLEGKAVEEVLSSPRLIERTSEWVEIEKPSKGSSQDTKIDPKIESLYRPLSTIYIDHGSKTTEATAQTQRKTKNKTRSQPSEMQPSSIVEPPSETPRPPIVKILVDTRALKVFRTLFYDPTITSTPGEISWHDFIYALTSTGQFSAEKLYGSVWQFERVNGPDQSRIQFHEPHPRGRIPFVVARRHGRRLNRAYGWERNMFELK